MNVSDFTYLLQEPEKITLEQVHELNTIIEEYPYFQAPKAVYLKGLKNLDSFKYNDALKNTAAYTTDRSILFEFITSKSFEQHNIANTISEALHQVNDIKVNADIIDVEDATTNPLAYNKDEAETILDPNLFKPKDPEMAAFLAHRNEAEKELELGKPLSFNKAEYHSFSEWLKLSSLKTIDRSEDISKTQHTQPAKFELIDKFISTNPKITPSKETSQTINLAERFTVDKSSLMTETLARVYLEQKKYTEAIQAYKILSLKYPEKSGFFADQIRAIEKLQ